ncbi:hypothetical protein EUX98_g8838 [Antrodiella citrinella]|uniref:Uncharacterized protein n=1 Tax=Antrodiella citrinella TaxID=2447956 RepID=A0A4V3XFW8_9APHY|nr:hypothetical protein EUX98_g8838 [Antrodiella citrinella]
MTTRMFKELSGLEALTAEITSLKQKNVDIATELQQFQDMFSDQMKQRERLEALGREREAALASLREQAEALGREREVEISSFRRELLEAEKKYQDLLAQKPEWFDDRYREDEDARKVRKLHDLIVDRAGMRGKLDELETQIRIQSGLVQRELPQQVFYQDVSQENENEVSSPL